MELMRITDVAEILSVSPARVYALIREGRLPAVRIGRQVRVHPGQLEDWMAKGGMGLDAPAATSGGG